MMILLFDVPRVMPRIHSEPFFQRVLRMLNICLLYKLVGGLAENQKSESLNAIPSLLKTSKIPRFTEFPKSDTYYTVLYVLYKVICES
jgi:hypothetical protein